MWCMVSEGRGVDVVHGVTKGNVLKWCMIFQCGVQCGSWYAIVAWCCNDG